MQGLILGIVTGLVITFFDSLFMLKQIIYVPYSYPFVLIIFNILFWAVIGTISGFLFWMFTKERDIRENEAFYWVLFFLIPFAIIYGVLGRLYIPQATVLNRHTTSVFDHHLSFIWVAFIISFLLLHLRKNRRGENFSPLLLTLEIVALIVIFQFCSNLQFIKAFGLVTHLKSNYLYILKPEHQMPILYIMGILSIGGVYVIAFTKIRPTLKKLSFSYEYTMVSILCCIGCGLLFMSFILSQRKNIIMEDTLTNVPIEYRMEKKVSHVILIVLDTLRADRLSTYNDTIDTSKNLEMLSKDSLVFERCIAPSSWTLPSHASLFTGLYVSEHKCEFLISPLPILSKKCITLAEIFRERGYKTAAVVSNFGWLHPKFNIHQGFQIYDCLRTIGIQRGRPFKPVLFVFSYFTNIYSKSLLAYRNAEDVNREAINLLGKKNNEPLFLFLNYMDTHTPYQPPRPFDGYFLDKKFPQLYRLTQYFLRLGERHDKSSWDSYLLSQYDGEVAYLDNQLGKLFSYLKKIGIYDSSLIIVTSDHGELLGEHGLYEHHSYMYEGVLKIPLIIKFPFNSRVGREKMIINLTDVFPTILSICDLPLPDNISGKPFGNTPSSAVAELYSYVLGEHSVIYDEKYKYMVYKNIKNGKEKNPELYDLGKDPEEKENLAEKYPGVASAMQTKLEKWKSVHKKTYPASTKNSEPLSEELKDGLRALGYVQ